MKKIDLSEKELRDVLGESLMEMNQELTDIDAKQRVTMNKICLAFIAKVMKNLGVEVG